MSAISDRLLEITKPYMGPATESFLARQCQSHLHVELAALQSSHMKDLAKWVELGAKLLMDPAKAADLGKKISAL